MSKKSTSRVNTELEKALADELKEVMKKHPATHEKAGTFVYDTLERMRIIDRCLKWESVKQKSDDPEWGKEFK